MISDVLFDASVKIKYYLTEPAFAGVYDGPIRPHLDMLLELMAGIQDSLDNPNSIGMHNHDSNQD